MDFNGTLDGVSFTEQFGRKNYYDDEFFERKFQEPLTDEFALQIESVKKYGGFYISRYHISKSLEGKPQSIKGIKPWTDIAFRSVIDVASSMEDNEVVKSHLTFGAEYDSVLEWFVKSKVLTRREIKGDYHHWANHNDYNPTRGVETGSREEWCRNNIYDFAANVDEWTQEIVNDWARVIRGGNYAISGRIDYPVGYRGFGNPSYGYFNTGFRAALYIK